MSGSTVRQFIPALVAVFAGAGVAGLQVSDGPIWEPNVNFLAVGWSPTNPTPIHVQRVPADVALRLDRETCDVACVLSFWKGSGTAAALRDALLDAFDVLDAALKANPKIGGAARARITEYAITPDIYETGEWVACLLTVNVGAWK